MSYIVDLEVTDEMRDVVAAMRAAGKVRHIECDALRITTENNRTLIEWLREGKVMARCRTPAIDDGDRSILHIHDSNFTLRYYER